MLEGAEFRRLGRWYGDAMVMILEHAKVDARLILLDMQRALFPG